MNRKKAIEILGIKDDDDEDEWKRKYRAKILQYHPDKNSHPGATDKFREVKEAYEVLMDDRSDHFEDLSDSSYEDAMRAFFSTFNDKDQVPILAKKICELLISRLWTNSSALLDYLAKINRPLLALLYKILLNYGSAFHLPEGVLSKVEEVLNRTLEEYIVLNPTLEDLLSEENIYKLKYGENTYFVPLWHHDMVFDRGLNVRCFPILPDNMELDECNVLTVRLEYSVEEVWNREVELVVGGRLLKFDGRDLRMTEEPQKILLNGCGVPYNNIADVLDCGVRQDILLEIVVSV